MIALDTNILVYAVDAGAGERHEVAARVLDLVLERGGMIPLQVLAEFANVGRRKLDCSAAEIDAYITSWVPLVRVERYAEADLGVALRASEAHQLQFWDALIWAVCDRFGVATLVSEDFQNGRTLGRVTFLSPFDRANAGRLGLA